MSLLLIPDKAEVVLAAAVADSSAPQPTVSVGRRIDLN
jgi:hypothetical protein